jgi:hypothetical protein
VTQCTPERFLKEVATHEMHILHEDGVYRHIRFKRPGTGCMHFDLITYPGYLVYSGDMGCYVFSRLEDMFQFFRTDREYQQGEGLKINKPYWAEKLQAVDGNRHESNVMEFDEDAFIKVINEYRVRWMREGRLDKDERRELWEAVDLEVLDADSDTGGFRKQIAAHDFSFKADDGRWFCFEDLFEYSFKRYTFSFEWCCYAIAWGVKKYDEAKGAAA